MTFEFGLTALTLTTLGYSAKKKDISQYSRSQSIFTISEDIEGNLHFTTKKRRKTSQKYTFSKLTKIQYENLIDNYINQTIPIYCRCTTQFSEVMIDGFVYIEGSNDTQQDNNQFYSLDITIHEL
jgi:hypothetical protein